MSTCTVSQNQPIYQALLDKAASYPVDKPYQAKAYKKAAESVSAYPSNIYTEFAKYSFFKVLPAGIGYTIENFIYQFIKTNPDPSEPTKPVEEPVWTWADYLAESRKPVVYTAENPRRSKRNSGKPTPKYFDENDLIAEEIEAVCVKKGYKYSDDLIAEFNEWLPTAGAHDIEKYDMWTNTFVPRTKVEIAKEWTLYYSKSIKEQKKQKRSKKTIINYCKKNGIEYTPLMDEKFAQWCADPANKKLITYTYNSCYCSNCDPTGTKKANTTEYSYDRTPTYCVNKWFSTLKKTVVF